MSIEMVGGVDIYGGFAGGETALHDRDWSANQTVLSGEIKYLKPSYHVVRGADHARLDGFLITDGQALQTETDDAKGAGMFNDGVCPVVANCIFKDNRAHYGAGMYNRAERVEITASVFEDNLATYSGGGIYNSSYQDPNTGQYRNGDCVIKETIFKNNQAANDAGGGLYNEKCNLDLSESEFRDNQALKGGAIANSWAMLAAVDVKFVGNSLDKYHDSSIHYGGAVYNEYTRLTTFNRCVFQGNSAGQYSYMYSDPEDPEHGSLEKTSCGYGGALYNKGDQQNYPGSTFLANCVLLDNVGGSGGSIYHYGSHSRLAAINCTFYGNAANGQGTHSFYNPPGYYYGGEGGTLCNNEAETELINCILWDNPATADPNEIFNRDGSGSSDTLISNCIVKDCYNGEQWDSRLGTTLGGNLSESPLFTQADDPNGPDDGAGTWDDGVRLQGASCGIDGGSLGFLDDPNYCILLRTDLLAGPRIQYGGQKNQIDIGAYEFCGISAMDQHVEIDEDPAEPVVITLEATDINQQELVFIVTDGPRHGKVEINGSGPGCLYSPDPNYNGEDSFGFQASSGINSDCAAVSITIQPQDDPPCPDDDTITMKQADAIQFNVLANDYHPDGKSFSLISYDDSHETSFITSVYSDGTIDFEPAQDYYNTPNDPYQFSYVVQDTDSNISAAGVSVRVHAVPQAGADSLVTWRNLLLRANVFENDCDPDQDVLAIGGWTLPEHGTLAYHGSGSFSYLPADNYTGTDGFEYVLQDPAGNIDTAAVTINVIHAPDDPNTIDTDLDGLSDILEMEFYGSDPNCADTDKDGLVDSWEAHYNQNVDILIWDYESADPDDDGLTNIEEAGHGTNPNMADTDGDGMSDFAEVELGYDPLVA